MFVPKLYGDGSNMIHILAEYGLAHKYKDLETAFEPRVMDTLRSYFSSVQLLTAQTDKSDFPLTCAARARNVAMTESLSKWTPLPVVRRSISTTDSLQMPLLHWACGNNILHLAKCLLEAGADVNSRREGICQHTALHEASSSGGVEIGRLLCEHGASVHERAFMGRTPLHEATECNSPEIVRYLLAKMHDFRSMHPRDTDGCTPLMGAIDSDTMDCFAPWQRNHDWHVVPEVCSSISAYVNHWQ